MEDCRIVFIAPIHVSCADRPEWRGLVRKFEERVQSEWDAVLRTPNTGIYNGLMLSFINAFLDSEGVGHITGHYVEYRHYLAQRNSRGVLDLGIKPIGVSGLVTITTATSSHVLFGKRADSVTQYPGYWELMPSGGIDDCFVEPQGLIDYVAKIRQEFEEETGLLADVIHGVRGFTLLLDEAENVYDIGCEIAIEGVAPMALQERMKAEEYCEHLLILEEDLDSFVKAVAPEMVPTSVCLVKAWKQWKLNRDS